ncbi:uncharacterized protein AruCF_1525 [Achromobacter ruhlandii]|nr:uncharacterized protein AruCF_1525 [Achromobacter ruhlandii]
MGCACMPREREKRFSLPGRSRRASGGGWVRAWRCLLACFSP